MRRRSASASAVFVLLVAACGDSNESASPSSTAAASTEVVEAAPAPVGGLVATIGTNRLYSLERGFGLGMRNVGDEPVVVRELQLVSPLFEIVPLVAEEVLLQPGGRQLVLPLPDQGDLHVVGNPAGRLADSARRPPVILPVGRRSARAR